MKHIKEILAVRAKQIEEQRRASLFAASDEKGSGEWGAFNAVRGDRAGGYPVGVPRKQQPRLPGFIEMVPRPNRFTPRPAH